jgi:hypothetical protein
MGLALFKERRLADRKRLTGLLPGRLLLSATRAEIVCRPVDVSANGLGIVIDKEIDPGTELELHLKSGTVRLQVAWAQPDFGKQNMFRYGLVTLDPSQNLEAIFVDTGCLR